MIYFAMGGVAWAIPGNWRHVDGDIAPSRRLPQSRFGGKAAEHGGGGGMFTSNTTYWLDRDFDTVTLREDSRSSEFRPASRGNTSRTGWMDYEEWGPDLADSITRRHFQNGWIPQAAHSVREGTTAMSSSSRSRTQASFPVGMGRLGSKPLLWAEAGCRATNGQALWKIPTNSDDVLVRYDKISPVAGPLHTADRNLRQCKTRLRLLRKRFLVA